ncbi:MAG: hypothetical protein WAN46_21975 [Gammaproteobacteria bacterium]|jgi:hypothetical protein
MDAGLKPTKDVFTASLEAEPWAAALTEKDIAERMTMAAFPIPALRGT